MVVFFGCKVTLIFPNRAFLFVQIHCKWGKSSLHFPVRTLQIVHGVQEMMQDGFSICLRHDAAKSEKMPIPSAETGIMYAN